MPQASRTRGEKQPPRSIVPKRVEVPRPRCKPGSEYSFAVHTIHVEPTALHRLHPQRRPLRKSWREVRSFRRQKLATDLFVLPFTYLRAAPLRRFSRIIASNWSSVCSFSPTRSTNADSAGVR